MGPTLQRFSAGYDCIQCTFPACSDPQWVFHPERQMVQRVAGVVGLVLRLEAGPEQVSQWLVLPAVGGWQKGRAHQCSGTRALTASGYGTSDGVGSADGDDVYAPCSSRHAESPEPHRGGCAQKDR